MVWTLLCDTTNLGTIWRRGRCGGCHPQQQSRLWGSIMKHCSDLFSYPFESTTKLIPIFQWLLLLSFLPVRTKNIKFPDFRNSCDSETCRKQFFKSSKEKMLFFPALSVLTSKNSDSNRANPVLSHHNQPKTECATTQPTFMSNQKTMRINKTYYVFHEQRKIVMWCMFVMFVHETKRFTRKTTCEKL